MVEERREIRRGGLVLAAREGVEAAVEERAAVVVLPGVTDSLGEGALGERNGLAAGARAEHGAHRVPEAAPLLQISPVSVGEVEEPGELRESALLGPVRHQHDRLLAHFVEGAQVQELADQGERGARGERSGGVGVDGHAVLRRGLRVVVPVLEAVAARDVEAGPLCRRRIAGQSLLGELQEILYVDPQLVDHHEPALCGVVDERLEVAVHLRSEALTIEGERLDERGDRLRAVRALGEVLQVMTPGNHDPVHDDLELLHLGAIEAADLDRDLAPLIGDPLGELRLGARNPHVDVLGRRGRGLRRGRVADGRRDGENQSGAEAREGGKATTRHGTVKRETHSISSRGHGRSGRESEVVSPGSRGGPGATRLSQTVRSRAPRALSA